MRATYYLVAILAVSFAHAKDAPPPGFAEEVLPLLSEQQSSS